LMDLLSREQSVSNFGACFTYPADPLGWPVFFALFFYL